MLAPPSFVSDDDGAGSYTWSVDGASEFAKAPEWLFPSAEVAELDKRRPAEHWQRISRGVPEGSRNQHEASMFGHLLRKGVDPEVAINCMRGWNMLCTPPQDEESLLKTLKSILEAELKRRGRA